MDVQGVGTGVFGFGVPYENAASFLSSDGICRVTMSIELRLRHESLSFLVGYGLHLLLDALY